MFPGPEAPEAISRLLVKNTERGGGRKKVAPYSVDGRGEQKKKENKKKEGSARDFG